jgi:hypothetical protein
VDEVESRHQLRDRVLDLQAGVHLQEKELVARQEELHGPGVLVARRARQARRGVAHAFAQSVGQGRRGGLLDHLLVPALDRALPLVQMDHVAVPIGEDLHLDVPRPLH